MAVAVDRPLDAKLARKPGTLPMIVFGMVLVIGGVYALSHLVSDLSVVQSTSIRPSSSSPPPSSSRWASSS